MFYFKANHCHILVGSAIAEMESFYLTALQWCFQTRAHKIQQRFKMLFITLLLYYSVSFSFCPFVSGLVVPETRGNETVPEVVTTSGYALLHFFSDAAYNLTGFNIAYSYVSSSALLHSFSGLFCLSQCQARLNTHRPAGAYM